MLKAHFKKYQLQFKFNALTSRGGMEVKNGYYLFITDGTYTGIGECSYIEGLSIDSMPEYERTLQALCVHIENETNPEAHLSAFPSIKFGWETAVLDLQKKGSKILFESAFTRGESRIPINGLIWMGSRDFMARQINQKLSEGFKCIKLKIGALYFDEEIMLLDFIRQLYPADQIELRLDANGAFGLNDVFEKLDVLSRFDIHSIEQPVKQGQPELMKKVCAESPIPVALDEELIDLNGVAKQDLLRHIKPQYIILKPSLLGGFKVCNEWIRLCEAENIKWWATSALESNLGLNAIAQWVFTKNEKVVQGLGTGGLYTQNITSPLFITAGTLGYDPALPWGIV